MTTKADLILALKAYADASTDLYLRAAWGTPGSWIEIENETVATGTGWRTVPSFVDGLLDATATVIDDVQSSPEKDDFTLVAATSATLTKTPVSAGGLQVFKAGLLLKKVTSPTTSSEYSWVVGSATITFGAAVTGWVSVYYLSQD